MKLPGHFKKSQSAEGRGKMIKFLGASGSRQKFSQDDSIKNDSIVPDQGID